MVDESAEVADACADEDGVLLVGGQAVQEPELVVVGVEGRLVEAEVVREVAEELVAVDFCSMISRWKSASYSGSSFIAPQ